MQPLPLCPNSSLRWFAQGAEKDTTIEAILPGLMHKSILGDHREDSFIVLHILVLLHNPFLDSDSQSTLHRWIIPLSAPVVAGDTGIVELFWAEL